MMDICKTCDGNNFIKKNGAVEPCPDCCNRKLSAREDVLTDAIDLISGDREDQHGDPVDNFRRIATGWSALFGVEIAPHEVGLAMVWLKMSRIIHKPSKDSFVDIAGYAALSAELADHDD